MSQGDSKNKIVTESLGESGRLLHVTAAAQMNA